MSPFIPLYRLAAAGLPLLFVCQTHALTLDQLKGMSLDELSSVEVSIASQTPQKLSESAAAVYLITHKDIRRSGATSLSELLRMVPGMNVASINASTTAVSARGFHDIFSNKFLVLMDGRTLNTPIFSGVSWDAHDIDLSSISRIEVIRGPSAAVWGANAMNGVINIITRSALADGNASRISLASGNQESIANFSHTHESSKQHALRVFGKLRQQAEQKNSDGSDAHDSWEQGRIGFRSDSDLSPSDTLSVSGDLYRGHADQILGLGPLNLLGEQHLSGGYLSAKYHHTTGEHTYQLQSYFDHSERSKFLLNQRVNTFDIAFRHAYQYSSNGNFSWSLNYRHIRDASSTASMLAQIPSADFRLSPGSTQDNIWGIAFQEAYRFSPRFNLLAGVRFDHHAVTGWETQPSLRATWNLSPSTDIWAALSHSIRTPSRYERHLTIDIFNNTVTPSEHVQAENLKSAEAGFRYQGNENFSLNGAAFYNRYDNLASVHITPDYTTGQIALELKNEINANSYGFELDSRWHLTPNWQLKASYSWMRVESDSLSPILQSAIAFNNLPKHQLYLNSAWDLPHNLELDATLYYVDKLKESQVDGYTRFDLRLGWIPRHDLEVSLAGKNLFNSQHAEYIPSEINFAGGVTNSEVERSITAAISWKF